MGANKGDFSPPRAEEKRVVYGRFNLRRETKTKAPKHDASVFSYSNRGRGPNGESSN